jgi:uncharacterized radical SAM superfamily Fe-S cluster-containing enzyme
LICLLKNSGIEDDTMVPFCEINKTSAPNFYLKSVTNSFNLSVLKSIDHTPSV